MEAPLLKVVIHPKRRRRHFRVRISRAKSCPLNFSKTTACFSTNNGTCGLTIIFYNNEIMNIESVHNIETNLLLKKYMRFFCYEIYCDHNNSNYFTELVHLKVCSYMHYCEI